MAERSRRIAYYGMALYGVMAAEMFGVLLFLHIDPDTRFLYIGWHAQGGYLLLVAWAAVRGLQAACGAMMTYEAAVRIWQTPIPLPVPHTAPPEGADDAASEDGPR